MTSRMATAIARAVRDGISFRPAAQAAQISGLEEQIGRALPEELRRFYETHDGAEGLSVAANEDLLSVEEMKESWTDLRDVWSEIDAQPGMWSSAWLPVTHDGGGSFLCVDLGASDGSTPIIRYWHADPDRPRVASSFTDWLATVVWTPDRGVQTPSKLLRR